MAGGHLCNERVMMPHLIAQSRATNAPPTITPPLGASENSLPWVLGNKVPKEGWHQETNGRYSDLGF
jgi:hypothetical protein